MPTLIDRTGRRDDAWQEFTADAASVPAGASVLLPLAEWRANRARWLGHAARVGVRLTPADDPAAIADDLDVLALVAIEFPAFTDGRGYSIARLLRERYGWKGELRAVGEVLRDQLFYLARCGFDTFALSEGQSAEAALAAFADFSESYQSGVDRGPLFARRLASAQAEPSAERAPA